jgi:hypothetical protein
MKLKNVLLTSALLPCWLVGCTTPQTDFHGNATPGKTDASNPDYTSQTGTLQPPPPGGPVSGRTDPLKNIGTSQSNGGSSAPTSGPS